MAIIKPNNNTLSAITGLPAGVGGKVLQTINFVTTTETVTSSGSFGDTGLTASITPSSSSNKILIFASCQGVGKATNNTYARLKLLRGSTDLTEFEKRGGSNSVTQANKVGGCSVTYLDSPSTTSSTTYKVQLRSGSSNSYAQMGDSASASSITLMEIAG